MHHYEIALNHRDKLIDYDLNAARRLGVLDERSDWYDLSQNTWLNKDQRKFASQMLEAQKKKEDEIDKQNVLSIDIATGTATIVKEENEWSTFQAQNEQVQQYMETNVNIGSVGGELGSKFKPFEGLVEGLEKPKEQKEMIFALRDFQMKPCDLHNDVKSQKLYDDLNDQIGHNAKKKKVDAPPAVDPKKQKFHESSFS